MESSFADILRDLRTERNLSQQQLANKLFVNRSSISHWESGRHIPDAILISRIAQVLGVDIAFLLSAVEEETTSPNVIIVDDEDILLAGALPILSEAMPGASIIGFNKASEAISFARGNQVAIAFLDIELGTHSGLDLSRTLTEIYPLMNIIFLTSYPDYALAAWNTIASAFLVKPLHLEDVHKALLNLRHPVRGIGTT